MSTSRIRTSELEADNANGLSAPLLPEIALRLSREVSSNSRSQQDPKAPLAPTTGNKSILPQSLPQRPLTPTTSSISKSRSPSVSRSQSHERSSVSSRGTSPSVISNDSNQENRQTIVRSYAPRVAVYASTDTEEFVRGKGFKDGLYGLLRPYGERLQGKVIIRDSIGSSKAWEDYGIRFLDSQHLQRSNPHQLAGGAFDQKYQDPVNGSQFASEHSQDWPSSDPETAIDQVLDREGTSLGHANGNFELDEKNQKSRPQSLQLHKTYLRKVLSDAPLVPYETFSHPVACVIAVSSRHPAPIEALRQLYASTGHGSNRTLAWVGTDYLRYYILIHDEEKDDITKSTALFDLMKRHFGLHCYLLRLRSSQCVETDDDSIRVPLCEWLSAREEMDQYCAQGKLISQPILMHANKLRLYKRFRGL